MKLSGRTENQLFVLVFESGGVHVGRARGLIKGEVGAGVADNGCSVVKVVRREESAGEYRLRSPFIPAR